MNGDESDGRDGDDNDGKHDHDEPGGSIGLLGRGLGDSHRVDKGLGDESNEVHGFPIAMVAGVCEVNRMGGECIYLLSGLAAATVGAYT
jgi:hypothetical protein